MVNVMELLKSMFQVQVIVSYIWSTGSTTDTETSLCGGSTVSVTVTDENGCTADTTIIVPQPEEPSI